MPDQTDAPRAPVTLFLSYARADQPRADALARALEKCGYKVWWDALIEGGAAYAQSIAQALDRADAVLVLWSSRSIESDWVRDEAAHGRDRHRLVPILLDRCQPPLGFRQYQTIDLSRRHGRPDAQGIEEIHRAISACLGQRTEAPPRPKMALRRRSVLVGSGVAAAVLAGGGAIAWREGLLGGSGTASPSLAVLPFRELGQASDSWFAEGVTAELRAALARVASLQVLAGTSSAAAQAEGGEAQDIARKLGVMYLLSGSVQRAGELVRVTAELTDGRTGFTRWTSRLQQPLSQIFALQSDLAARAAQAMSIQLATDRPAPGGTRSVAAYQHFLKGRSLFNQAKDEETDRAAAAAFDLAIAEDPKFARAYAARSRSSAALAGEYAEADELKPLYDRAIEDARLAIELAPELAEGQLAMGYALFSGRLDLAGARPFYDKAYELGRGDADIVLLYALYCSRSGRPEDARAAVERAVLLDPLNPRAFRAEGSVAYADRRYADAIPPLRHALALNPKMAFAHSLIASALLGLGRAKDAKAELAAEPGDQFRYSGLAIVEHRLGNQAAAEQAMRALETQVGDSALYQQAQVLAQWGRADEAVARLRRARAIGDSGLIYLATDPMLDPLRRRPDFLAFLRELKLA